MFWANTLVICVMNDQPIVTQRTEIGPYEVEYVNANFQDTMMERQVAEWDPGMHMHIQPGMTSNQIKRFLKHNGATTDQDTEMLTQMILKQCNKPKTQVYIDVRKATEVGSKITFYTLRI